MKDSGIEWIGEIPEDWDLKKLKNVVRSLVSGATPDSSNDNYYCDFEQGTPWISIGDMSNKDYIKVTKKSVTQEGIMAKNLSILPVGTLIYSIYASLGNVSELEVEATTNQAILGLKIYEEKVSKNYLKYWLKSIKLNLDYYMTSNTQNNLNSYTVMNLPLVYPVYELQEQIAKFLDHKVSQIDSIIHLTKQSIEEYKKYKQSLITKVVTKGLDPNVKMKDSGIEWIDEIPEHWEVGLLGQVFHQVKNKNINLEETNLLSLSYGNVIKKDINTTDGLLPDNFSGYNIIQQGDIVLRLTDLQNDHKSLRVGLCTEKGIITSAYVTIRRNIDISSKFAYYFMHSFDIYKGFYGMGAGVRQGLNYNGIKKFQFAFPSIEEQYEIVGYLEAITKKIDEAVNKKEILVSELESYKKSLIYEVVTGKKEVS